MAKKIQYKMEEIYRGYSLIQFEQNYLRSTLELDVFGCHGVLLNNMDQTNY